MANETHDINDIKRRMQGASAVLKTELSGLRTGRASAHLLDPVMVAATGAVLLGRGDTAGSFRSTGSEELGFRRLVVIGETIETWHSSESPPSPPPPRLPVNGQVTPAPTCRVDVLAARPAAAREGRPRPVKVPPAVLGGRATSGRSVPAVASREGPRGKRRDRTATRPAVPRARRPQVAVAGRRTPARLRLPGEGGPEGDGL